MPRHILVIGDSISLAHVARAMVVARRLLGEGHRVSFATGPAHQRLAREEGFEPLEIYGVPPERAISAIRKGSHVFDLETVRRYVASDLEIIEKSQPDLIIADFRLSLNISAELAGMAYWSILNGYLTHHYAAPQSPPRTFPIVQLLGRRLSERLFPVLKGLALRYYAFNFNRCRRRHGLSSVRDIFDIIASPYGNLIADWPEFIPCSDLPDHFRYIGPLIWEPKLPEPDWLNRIDPIQPTVYVTMGSTGTPQEFYKTLTVLREAGYQVLTTTGGHLERIPEGVFAADLAPGSTLLRRSQAVVCHGGSLTIYQAIREGVPIVGAPTFHDQETNMQRVEALQWGVQLEPSHWEPNELLRAVERVGRQEYQQRVRNAQKRLQVALDQFAAHALVPEETGAAMQAKGGSINV